MSAAQSRLKQASGPLGGPRVHEMTRVGAL